MPEMHSNPQKLGRGPGSPALPSAGTSPVDTLVLVLQPPELWENRFLPLRPPACGSLFWQPWQ